MCWGGEGGNLGWPFSWLNTYYTQVLGGHCFQKWTRSSESTLRAFYNPARFLTLIAYQNHLGHLNIFVYPRANESESLGMRSHHSEKVKELVAPFCPTLCDPMNCSPPGSSVHGILQEWIMEWVAIPFSRDLPDSGIKLGSLALQADSLLSEPPGNT